MGGAGLARPEVTFAQVRRGIVLWSVVCGGAFLDAAFTRVGGCDVVRPYDWELRMRKVVRSFFPEEGVVRDMDLRAGNVGVLEADIDRRCLPTAGCWLHLNAGLPCQDDSKANRRPHPARLREHVATLFIAVQRLRAKYRKVAWFAENVVKRRSRVLRRRTRQAALDKPRVHDGQLGFCYTRALKSETAENRAFGEKQPLFFLPKKSEAWYVDKDTKLRYVQGKVCQLNQVRKLVNLRCAWP